jgi:hypothetical protein
MTRLWIEESSVDKPVYGSTSRFPSRSAIEHRPTVAFKSKSQVGAFDSVKKMGHGSANLMVAEERGITHVFIGSIVFSYDFKLL